MRRVLNKFAANAARTPIAGQPTNATHPELLKAGELTPGILKAEYAARRAALLALVPPNSLAILPAAPLSFMAGHIPHPYRQEADFLYLTGITQPQVVAVLGGYDSPAPGYTLFVADPNPYEARWTGERVNMQAATSVFGADEAFSFSQLGSQFGKYLGSGNRVLYDTDRGPGLHRTLTPLAAAVEGQRTSPLRAAIHAVRWRKSAAEMKLMLASAATAATGIGECMQLSQPGVSEHKLAATFEHSCKMQGASNMAYPSVVAGGPSATIIHYGENDQVVRDGELLLMDAGCERYGYASDVTRTWPVSGKFTSEQRAVYDVVYETYKDCLRKCRLGTSLRDIHQHSIKLISEGIADLGLLTGMSASTIYRDSYREFYPHSVGHWLGMDTHDCPSQSQDQMLQPGVVMTLEPGLYIPNLERYGRFAGIGVRLEDDIAITATGPQVMSHAVPMEPGAVEDLVGTASAALRDSVSAR